MAFDDLLAQFKDSTGPCPASITLALPSQLFASLHF